MDIPKTYLIICQGHSHTPDNYTAYALKDGQLMGAYLKPSSVAQRVIDFDWDEAREVHASSDEVRQRSYVGRLTEILKANTQSWDSVE